MLRVLPLRQTESGGRVLCLVSIGKVGALSLVRTWQRQNSFSYFLVFHVIIFLPMT